MTIVKGHSAKLEFNKWEDNTWDKRFLAADITVKGSNAEDIFDIIQDRIERKLEVEFSRCPAREENEYYDHFIIEYEHGEMTGVKKDIRDLFKQIKKELHIK